MKAEAIEIDTLLAKDKTQFIIPIYQRNYDWSDTIHCKQLLDDILEVGTNDNDTEDHFIGSIVYVREGVTTVSEIEKLIIIDGQQRLTTVTLIYLVLYRLAITMEDKVLEAKMDKYLSISNSSHPKKEELKLHSTEENFDDAIKRLKKGIHGEFKEPSKVIDNYNYLNKCITKENSKVVLSGLSKLMVVGVGLVTDDNPQKIFESLNSKGLELSQADLIRNYILMGLNSDDQEKIYKDYWEKIEQLAKDEKSNKNEVSDFIRNYLALKNKSIADTKAVYSAFKAKFPTTILEELEENLSRIIPFAQCYNKLVNPKNESDEEIRLQLEYINRFKIYVAYPFLMQVYKDYSDKKINIDEKINKMIFIDVLKLIQSFMWRRFAVGLQDHRLGKVFMTLYDEVDEGNYLMSLQKGLLRSESQQRFPGDKEVKKGLKSIDIYQNRSKTAHLLERLERSFENKEPAEINKDITIEHIFPQKPDSQWAKDLEEKEYNDIKETYLHTIGNLTLSGNNTKLSNKPFIDKRDLEGGYKDSSFRLNKYLSTLNQWNKEEIEKRSDLLAKRFSKIWEYPTIIS